MDIGVYNFDDDLISNATERSRLSLRVYSPEMVCVVLGRGSDVKIELNEESCLQDKVTVLRRHGGGCAVVLDSGNVIVSVVVPTTSYGNINEYFNKISDWLIKGLEKSGVVGVYRDGISDLVVKNRKVAGACMQRKRDYIFYSASILVCPEINLMERYLKHPPREPQYRKHRTHNDFVVTLAEVFDIKSTDVLISRLYDNLESTTSDIECGI